MLPSNKHRTLKCGIYGHSDHNLIATELKRIRKKYSSKEAMKITTSSSPEIFMITYHNRSSLEKDKVLKFHMNNFPVKSVLF